LSIGQRAMRAFVPVIAVALSAGVLLLANVAGSTSAGAATPSSTSVFYLALGASVSVGVQPTPTVPKGEPTDRGYANNLVAIEGAKGVFLQLTQLGCPGESTATFIYGGDKCYKGASTQLSTAVAFLQSHSNQDGLVTIDLGFNTIASCATAMVVSSTCAAQKLVLLKTQLAQIITTLRAAAGPNVTFVGVGHYNPFLAKSLLGRRGKVFAAHSMSVIGTLNDALRATYSAFATPMADVARAFAITDRTPVSLAGHGVVRINVAETCLLTWMCQAKPFGPNIHPNDAGYRVIAEAIVDVLPAAL
jgi:lysophospholipase L1-like esterase